MDHERNPAAALRTPLLRVRQLPRAVVLALLLIGLSSARLPYAGPGPTNAGSGPTLVTLTMPVQSCPGFPPIRTSSATQASVRLPSDAPDPSGSFQAWGSPPQVLLGPPDFTCRASFGSADGGLYMDLLGPDEPCVSQPSSPCPGDYFSGPIVPTDRIMADFNPGGAVSPLILACPYFPAAQAGLQALPAIWEAEQSRCDSLPPRQVVQPLDASSVAFYQAMDDTHPSPTVGIVISNVAASDGGTTGASTEATCTMPASSSSVCKSVLTAFLTGWGQSYDPAANSAATALDTLSWFTSQAATVEPYP